MRQDLHRVRRTQPVDVGVEGGREDIDFGVVGVVEGAHVAEIARKGGRSCMQREPVARRGDARERRSVWVTNTKWNFGYDDVDDDCESEHYEDDHDSSEGEDMPRARGRAAPRRPANGAPAGAQQAEADADPAARDERAEGAAANDGNRARAQARRGPKRKRVSWAACSRHMKLFTRAQRRAFDSNPRDPAFSWTLPPRHVSGNARARTSSVVPTPARHQLHPWQPWVPEQQWPELVTTLMCPACRGTDVIVAAATWARDGPRPVLGGPTGVWYLDCKQYRCASGCKPFYSTHPDTIKELPEQIRMQFGVLQTRRCAVDRQTADRIVRLWKVGASHYRMLMCMLAHTCACALMLVHPSCALRNQFRRRESRN